MNWKKFVTMGVLVMLLASTFGTVAAQTGVTPSVSPTPVEGTEETESRFFTHPIVALLGSYFGRETAPKLVTTATATVVAGTPAAGTGTPAAGSTVTPVPGTETGLTPAEVIGEEIAAYHEAGMGFGVLVKLYSMAEASVEACLKQAAATPNATPVVSSTATAAAACTPATVEELVTAFNSGTGMGQLFKEYGKPSVLGVGHARKELAKQPPVVSGTPQPTVQGTTQATVQPSSADSKSNRIPKIKPNRSTGNGNSNGNSKKK